MEIKQKRVLITGGSSGIGLALAHTLGAAGARIAITGRRLSNLDSALDKRFLDLKPRLAEAVRDHSAL